MTTAEPKPSTSNERFTVSESGMRELNSGREPWDLIKELIQNAWDESPDATECRVTIELQSKGDSTMVAVEDDGHGFNDIADAYTLMGHTAKRIHPTKRGRFNIGEKDVISVATEAEVETVGHTVSFPRTGSREVIENSRDKGTVVKVLMPWNKQQCEELTERLRCFKTPINYRMIINGLEVPPRPAKAIRTVKLPTVAQNSPHDPIRTKPRRTEIHFVEPTAPSGERWIYEMGIPVQTVDCPWDIDVMQKIPMSQQRNSISEAYLNRIYAETLNETHKYLEHSEFSSQWVKRAIEHRNIKAAAVKSTVSARFGPKTAFVTMDQEANRRAHEAGYAVVGTQSLSSKERELFRKHAGTKDSSEIFPTPPPPREDYDPQPGSNEERFAEWVTEMASQCKLTATVRYFHEPSNNRQADCSVSTTNPVLRFNTAHLNEAFFQPPYTSVQHWDLLFHELGHALSVQPMHGEEWGKSVSKASALIAASMTKGEDMRVSKRVRKGDSSSADRDKD